jgi:outer membrane protein assembly factor BamE
MMRTKIIVLALVLFSPLLSSCATYKMDIRQGNFVTPEMREKLKLGMTRQQVHYVLGTPMINDAFHADRWDYVYRLERGSKLIEKHRLTLYFSGDGLARVDDDSRPLEVVPAKSVNGEAEVKANEQQKDKK